jgi:competence protein ComEA
VLPPVPACLASKRQLQAAIADDDCERDIQRPPLQSASSNRSTISGHDIALPALDGALRVRLATLASERFTAGLDLLREGLRRAGVRSLSLTKEDSMFRTALSLVLFSCVFCAVPSATLAQGAQSKGAARSTTVKPSTAIVNLNTASVTDLEGLPGIGAKTAARIVEYRQKNGPFKKVEELMNVRGVGEKNFVKLKPQITVAPAKADHDHQNLP